jgi:dipeptidyl aminopeptidase/acylaminoacyl peptidase
VAFRLATIVFSTTCARKAHIGVRKTVPKSVPRRGQIPVQAHPTPTSYVRRNRPEIVDLRPDLESLTTLANRRLQPLGHLTAHLQVYVTNTLIRNARPRSGEGDRRSTVAFDDKFNNKSALYYRHASRLGTRSGHITGHTRRVFRSGCSENGRKTSQGDGFFDRRLRRQITRRGDGAKKLASRGDDSPVVPRHLIS